MDDLLCAASSGCIRLFQWQRQLRLRLQRRPFGASSPVGRSTAPALQGGGGGSGDSLSGERP